MTALVGNGKSVYSRFLQPASGCGWKASHASSPHFFSHFLLPTLFAAHSNSRNMIVKFNREIFLVATPLAVCLSASHSGLCMLPLPVCGDPFSTSRCPGWWPNTRSKTYAHVIVFYKITLPHKISSLYEFKLVYNTRPV